MILNETITLFWTQKLIGVAVFFQTIELLSLKKEFGPHGIWNWETIQKDFKVFPPPLNWIFQLYLSYLGFLGTLTLRLTSAIGILIWPQPIFFVALVFTSLLVCARWRGTFNGGSDAITQAILNALCVAALGATFWPNHPKIVRGALLYIALQSTLSYWIAGLVKIKVKEWRSGRALALFLHHPSYEVNPLAQKFSHWPWACLSASWIVMGFECLFPWALFNRTACLILVGTAFCFHSINVYVFGLNRFLFAWVATYPSLFYISQTLRT